MSSAVPAELYHSNEVTAHESISHEYVNDPNNTNANTSANAIDATTSPTIATTDAVTITNASTPADSQDTQKSNPSGAPPSFLSHTKEDIQEILGKAMEEYKLHPVIIGPPAENDSIASLKNPVQETENGTSWRFNVTQSDILRKGIEAMVYKSALKAAKRRYDAMVEEKYGPEDIQPLNGGGVGGGKKSPGKKNKKRRRRRKRQNGGDRDRDNSTVNSNSTGGRNMRGRMYGSPPPGYMGGYSHYRPPPPPVGVGYYGRMEPPPPPQAYYPPGPGRYYDGRRSRSPSFDRSYSRSYDRMERMTRDRDRDRSRRYYSDDYDDDDDDDYYYYSRKRGRRRRRSTSRSISYGRSTSRSRSKEREKSQRWDRSRSIEKSRRSKRSRRSRSGDRERGRYHKDRSNSRNASIRDYSRSRSPLSVKQYEKDGGKVRNGDSNRFRGPPEENESSKNIHDNVKGGGDNDLTASYGPNHVQSTNSGVSDKQDVVEGISNKTRHKEERERSRRSSGRSRRRKRSRSRSRSYSRERRRRDKSSSSRRGRYRSPRSRSNSQQRSERDADRRRRKHHRSSREERK